MKIKALLGNPRCLEIFLKNFVVTIDITSWERYSDSIRCNNKYYIKRDINENPNAYRDAV